MGVSTCGPLTRRNPYDYLPEEPNKPDIMQSSIVTENGTRLLGSKMGSSPRYHDGMDTYGDAYHARGKSGLVSTVSDRPMDDSYESGYGATGKRGGSGDYHHNGGVRDFARQSRLRSDYGYSPGTQGTGGYNASYSQQNGCSIGPNASNYHPGSAAGGSTVPPVGANY